jgi:hemoglobin
MKDISMFRKLSVILVAVSVLLSGAFIVGPANAQEGAKVTDADVLQAFGGKEGLTKIMDDFMIGLLADKRTAAFFKEADQARVKAHLVDQLCEILNGGCVYKGAKMKPMHRELGINREHFNALVEQLQLAMDKHNVPFRAQNKLLAVLAPMHRDIVTR